jgi:peptidoglycan/LPS O-acetylase OafA/YrhL
LSTSRWLSFCAFPVYQGAAAADLPLIVGPALILVSASLQGLTPKQTQWAERLGWLSYPLYCVHWPVGRLVWAVGKAVGAGT